MQGTGPFQYAGNDWGQVLFNCRELYRDRFGCRPGMQAPGTGLDAGPVWGLPGDRFHFQGLKLVWVAV